MFELRYPWKGAHVARDNQFLFQIAQNEIFEIFKIFKNNMKLPWAAIEINQKLATESTLFMIF